MKRISGVLLILIIMLAASAEAQRVALVSVGNELISGGWCDVNNKTLAAGGSKSIAIAGRTEGGSSVNGKYRMMSETANFEWANGEPAVNFAQYNATPASFTIRAKPTTAANTYTINFAAVDDANTVTPTKSCKITVSGTSTGTGSGTQKPDLKSTILEVKEGTNPYDGQIDIPTALTFKVRVSNVGLVAAPGTKITVNRFDHTCSGMSVAIGSQSYDALAPGASSDKEFTDPNPPVDNDPNTTKPTLATVCYKAGLQTATGGYYTDTINSNNTATTGVKWAVGANTPPPGAKFGDYLFGQFSNAKCVNCHAFTNTSSAKRIAHANRFASTADVTNSATCSGCHFTPVPPATTCDGAPGCVNGWRAAPSNANWTGKTAPLMCEHVKTAPLPAGHDMAGHLKHDTFVLWALGKMGMVMSTWNTKVDEWISGGKLCN